MMSHKRVVFWLRVFDVFYWAVTILGFLFLTVLFYTRGCIP